MFLILISGKNFLTLVRQSSLCFPSKYSGTVKLWQKFSYILCGKLDRRPLFLVYTKFSDLFHTYAKFLKNILPEFLRWNSLTLNLLLLQVISQPQFSTTYKFWRLVLTCVSWRSLVLFSTINSNIYLKFSILKKNF